MYDPCYCTYRIGGEIMNFYQFRDKVLEVYRPLFDPTIDGEYMSHLLSQCTLELMPVWKELTGGSDLVTMDFEPSTNVSNPHKELPPPTNTERDQNKGRQE
jgi:hypothetical protein